MKKYQLEGASFLVHEDKVYVELNPTESAAAHEVIQSSPSPRKIKKTAKGVRRCKACGKPGHRSDNCPEDSSEESAEEEESDEVPESGAFADPGDKGAKPIAGMSAADLGRTIQDLKAKGLTSVQVAAKLRCTLTLVNRYW
jgi:hypothetical protein